MSQEVKPYGDWIAFVEPDDHETAGGLVLPPGSTALPYMGVVIALGPECKAAQVGDRIMFPPQTAVLSVGVDDGKRQVHLIPEGRLAAHVEEGRVLS